MRRPKGWSIPLAHRVYVIKRDKNRCQYCGKKGLFVFRYAKPTVIENPKHLDIQEGECYNGKDIISFPIDHIISRLMGGSNEISNLALSCRRCNLKKAGKDRAKFNKMNRLSKYQEGCEINSCTTISKRA